MPVTLYFRPLACSLAARIALEEGEMEARYVLADLASDAFALVNPKRRVPALVREDGKILTEASTILFWIANNAPRTGLAGVSPDDKYDVLSWLSFVGSELHKSSIGPLIAKDTPEPVRAHAYTLAPRDLAVVEAHLSDREWLVGAAFTIADAYLFAVVNWLSATSVDRTAFPAIAAFHERMLDRPSVAAAYGAELDLYREAA